MRFKPSDRPDGRVVDVLAFWHGNPCSNRVSIELTQVSIIDATLQCVLEQVAAMGSVNSFYLFGIKTTTIKI